MKQPLPRKLEARIGGVLGWSFSASLTGQGVEYVEYAENYMPMAARVFSPTETQWRALKKTMDQAELWRWNTEYINPYVKDGTSWEFECEWEAQSIRTGGSNAFPSDPDACLATHNQSESVRFDSLLRAFSQLVGGEPFE